MRLLLPPLDQPYSPPRTVVVLLAVSALACSRRVPEPEPRPAVSVSAAMVADPPADGDPDPGSERGPVIQPRIATLRREDLVVGTGAPVKQGDTVRVHYSGRLLDGTQFDSSLDRDEPFTFTVGVSQVIKGWHEGVVGMQQGGKRRLIIPAELAYGIIGSPPAIPANAPLDFEIELLDIQ